MSGGRPPAGGKRSNATQNGNKERKKRYARRKSGEVVPEDRRCKRYFLFPVWVPFTVFVYFPSPLPSLSISAPFVTPPPPPPADIRRFPLTVPLKQTTSPSFSVVQRLEGDSGGHQTSLQRNRQSTLQWAFLQTLEYRFLGI